MSTVTPTSPAVPATIANLNPVSSLAGGEFFAVVQNGVTLRANINQIPSFTGGISTAYFTPTGTAIPPSGAGIYAPTQGFGSSNPNPGGIGIAVNDSLNFIFTTTGALLGSIGNSGVVFGCDSTNPLEAPFSGSNLPSSTGIAFAYNYSGTWTGQNQAIMGTAYVNGAAACGAAGIAGNGISLSAGSISWGFTSEATVVGAGSFSCCLEGEVNMQGAGNGIALILDFSGDNVSGHGGNAYQLLRMAANCPNNAPTYGITLSSTYNPLSTSGTVLYAPSPLSCAYGINFTGAVFSTAAFASTGFEVDGSGNVACNTLEVEGNTTMQNTSAIVAPYTGAPYIQFNALASATRGLIATNATSSGNPSLSTTGGDLSLQSNTGYISYGTYVASPATSSGYIYIHDAGGTLRKLMVGT